MGCARGKGNSDMPPFTSHDCVYNYDEKDGCEQCKKKKEGREGWISDAQQCREETERDMCCLCGGAKFTNNDFEVISGIFKVAVELPPRKAGYRRYSEPDGVCLHVCKQSEQIRAM